MIWRHCTKFQDEIDSQHTGRPKSAHTFTYLSLQYKFCPQVRLYMISNAARLNLDLTRRAAHLEIPETY